MEDLICLLPKAELHIHIEGTLEPELMFKLAQRNKIKLPYANVQTLKKAYQFSNLQSFLDVYYQGTQVLVNEEDFFDLTWAYLSKMAKQNVKHVELFFDPQTHLARNISFDTVVKGIIKALDKAEQELDITSHLLLCFLRDLPEANTFAILEKALDYQKKIVGIGLDSAEVGNPPSKFKNIFKKAKELGFRRVAHAGEEGPVEYIWEALNILDVERIDHGIRCMEDPALVSLLVNRQIPLTVCPLSNVMLKAVVSLEKHPLKLMLAQNLCVTVNSDDPAYFNGYISDNYRDVQDKLHLNNSELIRLAKNSFTAAFLTDQQKRNYIHSIDQINLL
ncbi:MAG: adenosine deaminase [Gammaproteobacteria bacterium]|nr:adenosine deaminase [Gammaproteobacteria bacterium]